MAWTASRRTVTLMAIIGVLLPSLAILQYRWLGELSGLEQMRARQNLEAGTVRLSTEFDARLAHLYASLSALEMADGALPENALRSVTPAGFVKHLAIVTRSSPAPLKERDLERTLVDEVPAIVLPVRGRAGAWLVATLDMAHIANDLMPEILAGCFEGGIP